MSSSVLGLYIRVQVSPTGLGKGDYLSQIVVLHFVHLRITLPSPLTQLGNQRRTFKERNTLR